MSNFWYFLGGCAAGALAVAAVQTFTEDEYSSGHSSSSADAEESPCTPEQESSCAASSAEQGGAATTGMAAEDMTAENMAAEGLSAMNKSLQDVLAGAIAGGVLSAPSIAGNALRGAGPVPPTPADMQKMSEQLAASVIGIVSEFLRQSQAAQRESPAASAPQEQNEDGVDTAAPITPNFAASQA